MPSLFRVPFWPRALRANRIRLSAFSFSICLIQASRSGTISFGLLILSPCVAHTCRLVAAAPFYDLPHFRDQSQGWFYESSAGLCCPSRQRNPRGSASLLVSSGLGSETRERNVSARCGRLSRVAISALGDCAGERKSAHLNPRLIYVQVLVTPGDGLIH